MGIPTTYLSLHDVTDMKATVLQSLDSPLILTIDSPHGAMQISLYLRDLDAAKTEFLADVISAAMHEPGPTQPGRRLQVTRGILGRAEARLGPPPNRESSHLMYDLTYILAATITVVILITIYAAIIAEWRAG
jgi:hypothetical protein